ncbi:all4735 [Nostoc sp. PCC 7120 = FACHB-418]|nr:all4735 [Nostoc sp. PCC 7120 = FACHB-418]
MCTFRSHHPERGWKRRYCCLHNACSSYFPITSPRKGMETFLISEGLMLGAGLSDHITPKGDGNRSICCSCKKRWSLLSDHITPKGDGNSTSYFRDSSIIIFPITSPRKGMETTVTNPRVAKGAFRSHHPERGWKHLVISGYNAKMIDFPITSPRKGMETSDIAIEIVSSLSFPITSPRKGMETR